MNDGDAVLAKLAGLGSVSLCECNTIHLQIGPMTLNLAPEAFAQMAILIREAMEKLREIYGARECEVQFAPDAAPGWKH